MSEASKSPIVIDESGSESPFSDTSSEPPIERVPLKQRLQELTDVEHMLAQSLAEASEALQALRPDVQANTRNSEEFAQHTKEYFRLLELSSVGLKHSIRALEETSAGLNILATTWTARQIKV